MKSVPLRFVEELLAPDSPDLKTRFFHAEAVFVRDRVGEIYGIEGGIGKGAALLEMLRPGGFGLYVGRSRDAPGLLEILFLKECDKAFLAQRSGIRIAFGEGIALGDLLRRADAKHDLVALAEDLPYHALVPGMLGLETA